MLPQEKMLNLKIITPMGLFWDGAVEIVTVKTTEGYIGLQKNHIPFVASLAIDELFINSSTSKDYKKCAVAGGLVYASKDEVSIITDAIDFAENIDLAQAERDKKEAEDIIKSSHNETSQQARAELALEIALNRIKVRSNK